MNTEDIYIDRERLIDLTCRRHLESSGPLNVTDLLKEVRKSDPVKNQRRD